jgi:SAM-dependent methyltransferase
VWDLGWHVMRHQNSAIQSMLAHPAVSLQGKSVLDFGCGTRPYEEWFGAAGAQYHGADIDGSAEVAVRADGTLAAASAAFDMVASFQVLEHVWDLATYLGEARRVLKPGGWLLLSTHGSWFYHPHPGDYRRWTGEGLRLEVEAHGFRMLEMRPVVGPLAWTSILRSFGFGYALRKIPLAGGFVSAACALLFNLRAWLEDRITPQSVTANNACVYVALFQRVA